MSLSRRHALLACGSLLASLWLGTPLAPPASARPWVEAELRVALVTETVLRGDTSSTNRSVTALIHTQTAAPEGATAGIDVPAGLGVTNPVLVSLVNVDAAAPPPELDALVYWGVGSSIPAGQPRTRRWRTRSSLRYSEGATGLADPARLAAIDVSASGRGEYRARVSYAGETRVTVGPTNDFLDPLTLTHPLDGKVDFGRPLAIAWAPVPRATAYCVVATARGGDGRTVLWESAWRCDLWERHGVDWSMRNNIVLPLDQTSVTIPAGIFMGGPVQVQITAISAASNRAGPFDARAWAQSRTSFVIGGRQP